MCTLSRGERFKDARLVHNRNGKQSMDEVYAATGIAASMIKDLEDDDKERSVGYDKIAILARHYGVSTDYLLSLSSDPNRSPCATDELGLSVHAIKWFSDLATSSDKNRYTKYLSSLLEMDTFKDLIHLLMDYFTALEANSIVSNILRDFSSGSPTLYPSHKTYFDKLDAATKDQEYDDTTRLYLEFIAFFEKAFLNSDVGVLLDTEDDDDSVIHVIDILELKIKQKLDSVLRTIAVSCEK